jgi:hypothetical protein
MFAWEKDASAGVWTWNGTICGVAVDAKIVKVEAVYDVTVYGPWTGQPLIVNPGIWGLDNAKAFARKAMEVVVYTQP